MLLLKLRLTHPNSSLRSKSLRRKRLIAMLYLWSTINNYEIILRRKFLRFCNYYYTNAYFSFWSSYKSISSSKTPAFQYGFLILNNLIDLKIILLHLLITDCVRARRQFMHRLNSSVMSVTLTYPTVIIQRELLKNSSNQNFTIQSANNQTGPHFPKIIFISEHVMTQKTFISCFQISNKFDSSS